MKRPALTAALALIVISLFIVAYRIISLGYPLTPAKPDYVWTFRFDGVLHGTAKDSLLLLSLPSEQHGQIILEEGIESGSMSFNLLKEYDNRIGVWSGRPGPEGEYISYKASVLLQPTGTYTAGVPPRTSYPYGITNGEISLIEGLMAPWRALNFSARLQVVLNLAKKHDFSGPQGNADLLSLGEALRKYDKPTRLLVLLAAVNIPARTVEGLDLVEGVVGKTFSWVEVWTGQGWGHIDPQRMEIISSKTGFLALSAGGMSAVRASAGELSAKRFELTRNVMSRWRVFFERASRSGRVLDQWSLFRIPPEFQQTFRILLLVPLGALLITLLRNFVGFQTFGIFMPVLMALAFRNTGLFYGLAIFAAIVLIGYVARRGLDRMRLLLIPRMSVLVTLVIFCFIILALVGNRFGVRQFMAVGLLPFVILTMTIERFFVVVEEHGMRTAVETTLGSAAVSVITYLIIQWEVLQITFFVYPELLLFVMGLQILAGRYTGYRLSELIRFRSFRDGS